MAARGGVPRLRLRRKLERAIRRGHPWVYRDAIDGPVPPAGTEVAIEGGRGKVIARGWAEAGPIGVRVWSVGDGAVDRGLIGARVDAAVELRKRVVPTKTDCFRLVHGEGDRMPGVVCDVYGKYGVVALDGAAAVVRKADVLAQIVPRLRAMGVDAGVILRTGARGERVVEVVEGKTPPEVLEVHEHGMVLCVDLMHGQKTGLFLDQRTSRAMVRRIAKGKRVLDLYAYVGGFSAAAGKGGAREVVTVDLAKPAVEMARLTWAANGLDAGKQEAIAGDVPEVLRGFEAEGRTFDVVIADPPSFAPSAASVEKALRAYGALFGASLRLLGPGGVLVAGSCSSHVDRGAFEEVVGRAGEDARVVLQVVDRWGAPPDHPRLMAFAEGDYLKVIVARVV
jgi:23S rRNA (cytosine1962-C5)-methyltransferase